MVEHRLPKPGVAGSIPVSRSTISRMFSLDRSLLSVLSKTLWKTRTKIDAHSLRDEEPVPTVHRFISDNWFSPGWLGAGVHRCSRQLKVNF
jgi:hypothetical protein